MYKFLIKNFVLFSLFVIAKPAIGQRNDSCINFCPIDLNTDTVFYQEMPIKEFQMVTVPALFDINIAHTRAYLNYTIPFETFMRATGLSYIFGKILPSCSECNDPNFCASDINFKKVLGTNCTSFSWKINSNKRIYKDTTIQLLKFEISISPNIEGHAIISPNLFKYEFQDDFIHLKISDLSNIVSGKPKVILDYGIVGGEGSAWNVIIYPACKKPFRVPKIPIYIVPVK